jgi:AGCS family alanine or glycine:cation symporter
MLLKTLLACLMFSLKEAMGSFNDFLWTYILVAVLLGCAVWFTLRTRGVQFRMIGEMFRLLGGSRKSGYRDIDRARAVAGNKRKISSFQAFAVSLASSVGTGNLAGVAIAIAVGGPGAIFWMWVTAILGGASAFVESTLAQIYKKKDADGSFYGGPSYYMQDALGQRWLGVVFSVVLILTYVVGYNMLAAYNTQDTFSGFSFYSEKTPIVIGAILAILFAICVLGGGKRLTKVTEVLVPVMGVLYVLVSLFVVITHITSLPRVIAMIFGSAFNFKAIFGGFTGSCIMWGIKRGLYSNEAGMGSAPNAAAAADVAHPAKQGLVQMLSVFIDTLLICSATAFMCLFSGLEPTADAAGAAYVQAATRTSLGGFGPVFLAVAVTLFAFTTLLGNYYYTEGCLRFILKKKPGSAFMTVFRLCATALVFLGAVISAGLACDTADLLQALMVLINVPVILILAKPAIRALKDYETQRKAGKDPIYNAAENGVSGTECWTAGR